MRGVLFLPEQRQKFFQVQRHHLSGFHAENARDLLQPLQVQPGFAALHLAVCLDGDTEAFGHVVLPEMQQTPDRPDFFG